MRNINTATTTDKTPVRVFADHYQIESARQKNRFYDLKFNSVTERWECNCADADPQAHGINMQKNPNCKHVRRLRQHIRKQMDLAAEQQAQAQAQMVANIGSLREENDQLRQELNKTSDMVVYLELEVQRAGKRQQAQARELKEQIVQEIREFLQQQQTESQQSDIEDLHAEYSLQIDQLRADLALETELRQNQTRVWLEASTKQHAQEKALFDAVNLQQKQINDLMELARAQAAEIEQLKQSRKFELAITVDSKAPRTRPTPPRKAKAPRQQAEPDMQIEQLTANLYSVDGNNVIAEPRIEEANKPGKALSCDCENRKPCQHMKGINKILK